MSTTIEQLGFKFHVYPGEMNLLVKVFNQVNLNEFPPDEQETLVTLIDEFKDQVLNY